MKPETYRNRLKNKSHKQLIKDAIKALHRLIRRRDTGRQCISCSSWNVTDAGHFYKAGSYAGLRFNPLNIHGQCGSCNSHKSGNENEYRAGLISRYGKWIVEELDLLAGMARQNGARKETDRFTLIEIIMKYKDSSIEQITPEMAKLIIC